jgi:hypothetical protein
VARPLASTSAPNNVSVLSPTRRPVPPRCPVCLQSSREWQEGHNPMHCIYVRGPRSATEDQQVEQIHATRRMLQALGSDERVNYAGLDSSSTSPSPTPSDYLPTRSSPVRCNPPDQQPHRTFVVVSWGGCAQQRVKRAGQRVK